MKWIAKILILIVAWTIWVLLVPFPIKINNVEYISIITASILIIFGVSIYLYYHDYKLTYKIQSFIFVIPFLAIAASAVSLGYVTDNFGDPDIIVWDNEKRIISNIVFASMVIGCTVFPMELVGLTYGNKTK